MVLNINNTFKKAIAKEPFYFKTTNKTNQRMNSSFFLRGNVTILDDSSCYFITDINICNLNNCCKWEGICQKDGYNQVVALLLQIFLGEFGAGFGYINNWVLFSVPWIIYGSICFIAIMKGCICHICCKKHNNNDDDDDDDDTITKMCLNCICILALLPYYIYGIVVFAINDGSQTNGCVMI